MNFSDMQSGECRWVGRHDIHVYCHHPLHPERRNETVYYQRRAEDRRYAIACPDAGLDCERWMDEEEAILTIEKIFSHDDVGNRPRQ
jgi:hypothetical protein